MSKKRIGILTGGGDCPGLNAAVKWVVYGAVCHSSVTPRNPIEIVALKEGWEGVLNLNPRKGLKDERYVQVLKTPMVRKIDRDGGTAIGTSRTNPFSVKNRKGQKEDRSATVVRNIETLGLDALIAVGGEDTLGVANKLYERYGIPVVGIPKTIDLDLPASDYSLGFDSAVNNIKVLIDRARTVAGSHRRLAVIEVMGRHSGLLALAGGIVSSAHFTLIPEYAFELSHLIGLIKERAKSLSRYTLVVVAEGAREKGGRIVARRSETDSFGHVHLGGIGEILADQIKEATGLETISEKLGYLQRGGDPSAFDAKMGYYFGITAVDLIVRKEFGRMVSVRKGAITSVPLTDLNQPLRVVDVNLMYDKKKLNARRDTAIGWPVI